MRSFEVSAMAQSSAKSTNSRRAPTISGLLALADVTLQMNALSLTQLQASSSGVGGRLVLAIRASDSGGQVPSDVDEED
jgi:hypothetical protein